MRPIPDWYSSLDVGQTTLELSQPSNLFVSGRSSNIRLALLLQIPKSIVPDEIERLSDPKKLKTL
jgi:hypothetical protein